MDGTPDTSQAAIRLLQDDIELVNNNNLLYVGPVYFGTPL